MKLSEFIENKKQELISVNGYKSAEFKSVDNCEISQFMTSSIFDFGQVKKIDLETEVKDFERSTLGNNTIKAFEVWFNVIKPRCRKPETYRTYIAIA